MPRWTFYGRSTTISLVPRPVRQVRAAEIFAERIICHDSKCDACGATSPDIHVFSRRPLGDITPQTIGPSGIQKCLCTVLLTLLLFSPSLLVASRALVLELLFSLCIRGPRRQLPLCYTVMR